MPEFTPILSVISVCLNHQPQTSLAENLNAILGEAVALEHW